MKWKVGDKVKLTVEKEPYYSNYGGNPKVIIPAGTIGTVAAVNVPCVVRHRCIIQDHGDTFTCVDFVLDGVFSGNPIHKNITWRVAVYKGQAKKV